jgi:hypothetical protein
MKLDNYKIIKTNNQTMKTNTIQKVTDIIFISAFILVSVINIYIYLDNN